MIRSAHALYVRGLVALQVFLAAAVAHVAAPKPAGRPLAARGVTFIEYALLAAVAVVIALIFRSQLTSIFNSLFSKISARI